MRLPFCAHINSLRLLGLGATCGLLLTACGDDSAPPSSRGIVADDVDGGGWNNDFQRDFGDTTVGDCGSAIESEALVLLNADRETEGLEPLRCHLELLEVARAHCGDMIARQFDDHVNPDGEAPVDRVRRAGIGGFASVGENIARGQPVPARVEAAWMNSPGHRANILNPDFTHAAVGVAISGDDITWTQLFVRF